MTDAVSASEAILEIVQTARGIRPASLACAEAEDGLAVTLALLTELAVSNDRIDRLERMVAELRGESPDSLRQTGFTGEAATERQQAIEALMMRALRVFFDPRQPQPRPDLANML
jgi:hypothetical protein